MIKRVGVLTSGGDSPGMNAAIRATVRTAIYYDLHIYGFMNGYEGLIDGSIKRLEKGDVANIIQRGGTILKTSRSARFMTKEGRQMAYETLLANDIDALVTIGGNGTLAGAALFAEEFNIPIIGIPGTIDNDLSGTDYTIGFDSAINTAIEAVDKIRDTADSHNRLFFVEVMGRHSGYIAMFTGIGSGAGNVLVPEVDTNIDDLVKTLKLAQKRDKLFSIIIVAEGSQLGSAHDVANKVLEHIKDVDAKVTVIGHLQRGGSPSCQDRVLSSRLGYAAIYGLMHGESGVMAGVINNKVIFTPIKEALAQPKVFTDDFIKLANILAI
ncbi:MAG: 6-phosphofructokinase [Saprospiraceae bacterium]|jgi:6-phosphofructokinase 1|nr:6-phosphofructokinase [Candidatus Parvibacillus calidus]MBX2937669.1 6-phosphofructokinase [Saprospiraceae bacterium]MBX7180262.1 6-phosphofructokinase [Saprospiraceae bacterium]MCB0590242.1 6-phosphofructokinase [Saprospiraceae bacterium]MCO5282084.1 6-phosphofructokinase [Saprospiraceae bacterium]